MVKVTETAKAQRWLQPRSFEKTSLWDEKTQKLAVRIFESHMASLLAEQLARLALING